jgi:hypothetical protein
MVKKARNGQGRGYVMPLSFNPNNPDEWRALQLARQLASVKQLSTVLKGFLTALADYQERTGIQLTAERAIALVLSGGMTGHLPARLTPSPSDDTDIIMASASKEDAATVMNNFSKGIVIEDSDDLWD